MLTLDCDCFESPNRANDHRVTVLQADGVTWCTCVGWWGVFVCVGAREKQGGDGGDENKNI